MKPKAAGILLALLLLAGCAGAARDAPVQPRPVTPDEVRTAPAGGLWSQRFIGWPDGTMTAVGFSRARSGIGLVHLSPTGSADSSFRNTVHPEFGAGKLDAIAVARAAPDRLLIAGCQPPDCWGYFVLGRFHRDGSRDRAFGTDGLVRTSFPGGALEPRAIAVQSDGRIIVAGEVWIEINSSRRGFLARYLPDGRADRLFGNGGLMQTSLDAITAVATQPDGRIIAVGHRFNLRSRPASASVEVVRYLPDGKPDASFGAGGVTHIRELWSGRAVLIDRRGRILLAGSARGRGPLLTVIGLTASGSYDRAFGYRGRVFHRRPGDHAASVEALTPVPAGRIAATGWTVRGKTVLERRYRLVVLLLRSSGRVVRSFGRDGRMTLDGVEAQGRAAFRTTERRLVAVGADDDLKPRRIVSASIQLPR